MNKNIIKLNDGRRYQIVNDLVFSLNFAEAGMTGSSLGKELPKHIADSILKLHEKEKSFASRRTIAVKSVEREKVVENKPVKKKSIRTANPKSSAKSIKLGSLLKQSRSL